jgi:head-tail adaptor
MVPTQGRDTVGAPTTTFTDGPTLWADMRGAFAAERMSNNQLVAKADAVFTFAASSVTVGLSARHRLLCDGVSYDVLSVTAAMDSRRRRSIEVRAERRAD